MEKKERFAYTLKSVKLRLKVLNIQLYCLPLYHKNNRNMYKRVSTYAREKGLSVQAVYNQIEKGLLKSEKIDNMCFVCVPQEDDKKQEET